MKKFIIKGSVGIVVFFVMLLLSGIVMNQGNSNMTVEMGEASIPLVRIVSGSRKINTMHGYTKPIEGQLLKESVIALNENRNISIAIEKFQAKIQEISFEVRSTGGERLVEDTVISDYEENAEEITAQFTIKDLIDADTEYMLIILVNLEDGRDVRYYTRFIQGTDYQMEAMLNFAEDFHMRTFDKEAAKEITKYLESNEDGDNTTFSHVNIHSSFSQITWGDLEIKRETEPETVIRDITSQFGVVELSYLVSVKQGKEKIYHNVTEKYRIRYGQERMYLLDFERTMDVIFATHKADYTANKISIGITDPSLSVVECEGGNMFAFTQAGRLYSCNIADNKITMVFGFYDEENADLRTLYHEHDIKILSIDETGNIRFMVYGYMNRGTHEGNIGAQVYYYNSMLNTIEEEVYIPYDKPYAMLKKNLEQLSYVNNTNHLFLILDGILYDIDLVQKSCTQLEDQLSGENCQVSRSNRMVVWQNEGDGMGSTSLALLNLNTGKQTMIEAEAGQYIKPLGFMGEDLIYGVAKKANLAVDGYGGILFPMHLVKIQGESGEILKTYEQKDIFVVDAEITANQINLHRVKREGADVGDEEINEATISSNGIDEVAYTSEDYEVIADDQIMNTVAEEKGNNVVEIVTTEEYEKVVQIAAKTTIPEKGLKFLTPKEVAYEGGREIALSEESHLDYYYVFGPYGLVEISENESEAVSMANSLFGMVYDQNGNYLYRKGNLRTKNQIMKIEGDKQSEERNSLAVCIDTMLLTEGVTRNSAYLFEQGGTVLSILRENLPEAKVLDLTGCPLEATLYYVNQDIPVLAMLEDGEAVLIVGFNELNTVLMDPATGTVYKKGMNDSKAMFEKAGNRFITYVRGN